MKPERVLLLRGETIQLTVAVLDSDGDPLDGSEITWSSSDPAVAAVDSTGLVTALGFGEASITVTADQESDTAAVKVDAKIVTAAGTGSDGFSGDGGPATEAELTVPWYLAIDAAGNLYITDLLGHRIRRVNALGIITTVAGTGVQGFSGDGGPATQAQIDPRGLAIDGSGNLYVADGLNHRVRRVDPSGIISTVAGTGEPGFSGDDGPAIEAQLKSPVDVAVDAVGNLYIADFAFRRIRRVDLSGIITTIAGGGEGERGGVPATAVDLGDPVGIALDQNGNLYIADAALGRIWRVDASGTITVIAGGGGLRQDRIPATRAILDDPQAVAVDEAGNLYIVETGEDRVRRVEPSGLITTITGTGERGFSGDGGPASLAQLSQPEGVAVDAIGNLYISDTGNSRVRKVILEP